VVLGRSKLRRSQQKKKKEGKKKKEKKRGGHKKPTDYFEEERPPTTFLNLSGWRRGAQGFAAVRQKGGKEGEMFIFVRAAGERNIRAIMKD